MSDDVSNLELGFLGQSVEQLRAEVRTLRDALTVWRDTSITRQEWQAEQDKIMARLESIEAEVKYGFRTQLNAIAQLRQRMEARLDALAPPTTPSP
jgi:hypothetical protein